MESSVRGNGRSQSEVRGKAVLVLVSVTVTVYACEAFLWWDPLRVYRPRPSEGFDERRYLDVVRDLRADGISAYTVLAAVDWFDTPPRIHDTPVVPLSSIPGTTIVMCNEAGTYVTYDSDRFGFNAPDVQWDLPIDVALVGDSFVEGWCVPREASFGALIRASRPTTLNVGYAGHGPLAELGVIREYVASRRPAHVFWFFYEDNDLFELSREMDNPILRRYMEPGFTQQLQQHAVLVGDEMRRTFDDRLARFTPPAPEPWTSELMAIAKLRLMRGLTGTAVRQRIAQPEPPTSLAELSGVLAEAKRRVNEWGGTLHFVYLPDLPSVVSKRDGAYRTRVLALAADLGLGMIDLTPDFKNHPSPLSLFPYEEGRHLVTTSGLHYNAEGHRIVARRILDRLQTYETTRAARPTSVGGANDSVH